MSAPVSSTALRGCYVLSLRPVAQHAPLRRAAAMHGARVLALSPWRLQALDDPASREALRAALACSRIVFTSPAAVRAATHLQALRARDGQQWFAVGAGTAAALRRAGIVGVIAPARMDSDGLLALPGLQDVHGRDVGLVTAAGGREIIAPMLRQRGAGTEGEGVSVTKVWSGECQWASCQRTPCRCGLRGGIDQVARHGAGGDHDAAEAMGLRESRQPFAGRDHGCTPQGIDRVGRQRRQQLFQRRAAAQHQPRRCMQGAQVLDRARRWPGRDPHIDVRPQHPRAALPQRRRDEFTSTVGGDQADIASVHILQAR
jgi:hypothetical protein